MLSISLLSKPFIIKTFSQSKIELAIKRIPGILDRPKQWLEVLLATFGRCSLSRLKEHSNSKCQRTNQAASLLGILLKSTALWKLFVVIYGVIGPWWWSVCSPSNLIIRVRIPLRSTIFSVKLLLERMKINKKRPGLAH